jgi:peptide deformylase
MILKIVIAPDSVLKKVSEPVVIENEEDKLQLQSFMKSLVETCRHIQGIGLSAIQVGIPSRVFVVATEEDELYFVNPEIVETSGNDVMFKEGCLSFPGIFAGVKRPENVKIRYLNYNLEPAELEATGLVARCILHEYDHLEGKVFVDYVGKIARDMAYKKSNKAKKEIERLTKVRMAEMEQKALEEKMEERAAKLDE